MKIGDVEIKWLGHSGFLITNSKVIYIDPYNIKEDLVKADLILITHGHYDHCSFADIQKIVKDGTKIILTADSQIKISTFPAYNINKHFHAKNEDLVGYLIKMHDVLIYHAGDTDLIPEMKKLIGYKQEGKKFIALLPVGGRFTMSAEEACEAAKIIKPTIAIPMHYGSIVGSEEDALEFVELCEEEGIQAKILKKE